MEWMQLKDLKPLFHPKISWKRPKTEDKMPRDKREIKVKKSCYLGGDNKKQINNIYNFT